MGLYSEYSKQGYFKDTALQNRMNGVSNHSILGSFLVGNTTNIFSLATSIVEKSGESGNDITGPETTQAETERFNEQNKLQTSYNKAFSAFQKEPNKKTAEALKKAYESLPKDDNAYKSCYTQYKMVVTKVQTAIKQSA